MKTRMWFGASMAVNVILFCALVYYLNYAFHLPNNTPPAVRYIFTNASPRAVEVDGQATFHSLPPADGFDTNPLSTPR